MKTKLFTLLFALLSATALFAERVEIGNLYYNLYNLNGYPPTAEVTYSTRENDYFYNYYLSGAVVIPSSVTYNNVQYSVTGIGECAFKECKSLTSVTIPESVTYIGKKAFQDCSSLTLITIPESVTNIENYAFSYCSSLTSITIPENLTSIYSWTFAYCSSLTSITWNARNYPSITSKSSSPFHLIDEQITDFTFGTEVTTIPSYLCSGMSKLTSITIPESVTSIGRSAFDGCSSLNSVYYEGTLKDWCDIDFLSLSSNPCYYTDAFYINKQLEKNLVIPNSIKILKPYVFVGAWLKSIIFPEGLTTIGDGAFEDCTALSTLTIPNNVTTINSSAFSGCTGLRTLSLGSGITTIDNSAFSGCTALLTMEVKAALPPMIQSNTFNDVSTTVMLTIPCESQNYYKAAQYWNQFTNWQEAVLSFSAVTEDATKGKVSVTQKPTCDDPTAVIKAVPAGGYRFKEWSDGNTENPRTVWVDEEMDLVAYFAAEGDGVENITLIEGVSMAGNRLCIAGHEEENMNLYSATGAQLYAGQVRDITLPNAGVYLVQIGNAVQKLIVP